MNQADKINHFYLELFYYKLCYELCHTADYSKQIIYDEHSFVICDVFRWNILFNFKIKLENNES